VAALADRGDALSGLREEIRRIDDHKEHLAGHNDALWRLLKYHFAPNTSVIVIARRSR
jgi:hypothetical protein